MGDIIYEENFVKSHVTNNPNSIQYVLDQIREIYSSEKGWEVSDPVITPNPDGKTVTIKVHLIKRNVETLGRSR